MDLPDDRQNTRGKWRIEKGKLIRSWRFTGESADTTSVDEISDLNQKILKFRMIPRKDPENRKASYCRLNSSRQRA